MAARLFSLAVSNPGLAVRGMLGHKGIEHRVVDLPPGMQPVVRLLGFPRYTVPALVLDGGRKVQGSLAISRALDEEVPDPPLFPPDLEQRRRVEDAERWGEQVLQAVPRRLVRWMASNDYAVRRWLATDVGRIPGGALLARPSLQARQFARAAGVSDEAVRTDLRELGARLAEVERLRTEGVIGGAEPNAADFQIASTVVSLAKLGDLQEHLADHPAVTWAHTVLPPMPGPVPRALPAAWLADVHVG